MLQKSPLFYQPPSAAEEARPSYIRLVYPHRHPSWHFCGSLFSALALGYPTPYLTGWFKDPIAPYAAAERILDTYRYLARIEQSADEDIVIVTDGTPVWFQVKLDVLLERYMRMSEQPGQVVVSIYSGAEGQDSILSIGSLRAMRAFYRAMVQQLRAMSPSEKLNQNLRLQALVADNTSSQVMLDGNHEILRPLRESAERDDPTTDVHDDLNTTRATLPFEPLLGLNYQGPEVGAIPSNEPRPTEQKTWANVASLDSTYPAAIHPETDEQLSVLNWQRLWFYPQLRAMMSAEAASHVGYFETAFAGKRQLWWRFPAFGRGLDSVLTEGREAIPLQGVCENFDRHAFLDGNGWQTVGRNSLLEG